MSAHTPTTNTGQVSIVIENRDCAVREFVERESSSLLSYFLRRTPSAEDAADMLGETLLIIWRRHSVIPTNQTEARMWMFGVARRVLSGHRRSSARRNALSERLGAHLVSVAEATIEPDTDDLREAIAALPELDRELVRLVYWDGFTLADAAKILGLRPATARSRMARARTRLREVMAAR